MSEQVNTQTQITESEKAELLERRKTAIINLITELTDTLPPMVGMMIKTYSSTVHQLLDRLTFEQTEELIIKAQTIIDDIRG